MAKFKFSLEQVLRYRAQLEEQAKMALAKVKASLAKQRELLLFLKKTLAEQLSLPYEDAAQFWLKENYIRSLRVDIAAAEIEQQRLELALATAHASLVKRTQERQLLDKLKEKQAERYAYEENLKEQATLDEIAGIRHQAQAI